MKNHMSLLLVVMSLGILVGCTDSSNPEDGTMYTVSFDTSIDVISGIEDIRVPSGKTVDAPEFSTDVTYEEYDLGLKAGTWMVCCLISAVRSRTICTWRRDGKPSHP
jgi:hypothetical protein